MGLHMQGNGAGDKMCTRCGWTPHVCKVIQHVASVEAALGSFTTPLPSRIPVRLQVGVAELGVSNSNLPPLSQDHCKGVSPHRPEHSSESQGHGIFLIPRSPCRLCSGWRVGEAAERGTRASHSQPRPLSPVGVYHLLSSSL